MWCCKTKWFCYYYWSIFQIITPVFVVSPLAKHALTVTFHSWEWVVDNPFKISSTQRFYIDTGILSLCISPPPPFPLLSFPHTLSMGFKAWMVDETKQWLCNDVVLVIVSGKTVIWLMSIYSMVFCWYITSCVDMSDHLTQWVHSVMLKNKSMKL